MPEREDDEERPEWIKEVLLGEGSRMTWCGKKVGPFEFTFLNAEHAEAEVERQGRLVPCPACWERIQRSGSPEGEQP